MMKYVYKAYIYIYCKSPHKKQNAQSPFLLPTFCLTAICRETKSCQSPSYHHLLGSGSTLPTFVTDPVSHKSMAIWFSCGPWGEIT